MRVSFSGLVLDPGQKVKTLRLQSKLSRLDGRHVSPKHKAKHKLRMSPVGHMGKIGFSPSFCRLQMDHLNGLPKPPVIFLYTWGTLRASFVWGWNSPPNRFRGQTNPFCLLIAMLSEWTNSVWDLFAQALWKRHVAHVNQPQFIYRGVFPSKRWSDSPLNPRRRKHPSPY